MWISNGRFTAILEIVQRFWVIGIRMGNVSQLAPTKIVERGGRRNQEHASMEHRINVQPVTGKNTVLALYQTVSKKLVAGLMREAVLEMVTEGIVVRELKCSQGDASMVKFSNVRHQTFNDHCHAAFLIVLRYLDTGLTKENVWI